MSPTISLMTPQTPMMLENLPGKRQIGAGYQRLDFRPLHLRGELHAQQRIGLGHERDDLCVRNECLRVSNILSEVGRIEFFLDFAFVDAVRQCSRVEDLRLGNIPEMPGPVPRFSAQHEPVRIPLPNQVTGVIANP